MDKAEKQQRRAAAIADVAGGMSCVDAAAKHGLSAAYVHLICWRAGVSVTGWKENRNKQMSALYQEGATVEMLAKQFDLQFTHVRNVLRVNGMTVPNKKRGRPPGPPKIPGVPKVIVRLKPGIKYEHLDWTMQDSELARIAGISRERVRQVRKLLEKPKSPHHYRRNAPYASSWPEGDLAKLGKYTDKVTAEMIGRTRQAVSNMRNSRGIPVVQAKTRTLSPEQVALLGTMPDKEVAKRLGCHFMSVLRWRQARGIPGWRWAVNGGSPWNTNSRSRYPWTAQQLAQLGKISDGEMHRRYGMSMGTIGFKRRQLGIPPLYPPVNPNSRRKHEIGSTLPANGQQVLAHVARQDGGQQ